MGQVFEPLVFGRSTGLSPVAVIAAATFWTWLWGPIGLVLAVPLTVCLVVLGRHVEKFEFLEVALGDRPPLDPPETFYQRALGGGAEELADQAEEFLRENRLSLYYDEVALPGLALAQVVSIGRGGKPFGHLRKARNQRSVIDRFGQSQRVLHQRLAHEIAPIEPIIIACAATDLQIHLHQR